MLLIPVISYWCCSAPLLVYTLYSSRVYYMKAILLHVFIWSILGINSLWAEEPWRTEAVGNKENWCFFVGCSTQQQSLKVLFKESLILSCGVGGYSSKLPLKISGFCLIIRAVVLWLWIWPFTLYDPEGLQEHPGDPQSLQPLLLL